MPLRQDGWLLLGTAPTAQKSLAWTGFQFGTFLFYFAKAHRDGKDEEYDAHNRCYCRLAVVRGPRVLQRPSQARPSFQTVMAKSLEGVLSKAHGRFF